MEIDAREILEKLKKRDDRKRVSLYLSGGLYDRFREACGDVPASQVIEHLMERFVESGVKKGKK